MPNEPQENSITQPSDFPDARLWDRLNEFDQLHVLQFWSELTTVQQDRFLSQLNAVDLPLMQRLFKMAATGGNDWSDLAAEAKSPPAVTLAEQAEPALRSAAIARGEQALREGKVGFVLVAGGQGSRLGFEQPKGLFPIGPLSGRMLFEMHCNLAQARAKYYATRIPLYLMTSPATDAETRTGAEHYDYFGVPAADFNVFCQGSLPAVDLSGRLLLSEPGELFLSPDGHGGMLQAFQQSGCLADARERGLECLFYCQVDNPLAQVCDPLLIGLHLLKNAEVTSQVIRKASPLQKVGNVIGVGDRLEVIEYSDLPDELAHQTLPDGSLRFWAGNIAVHVFQLEFLADAAVKTQAMDGGLPFHIAKKKVPSLNSDGQIENPDSENAYKFERFIFDLLPLAKNAIVVEVDAAEGFAAVKNAEGAPAETPSTTKAAIVAQHRRWLMDAGVEVSEMAAVEIHPSVAHDPETVKQRLANLAPITQDSYLTGS